MSYLHRAPVVGFLIALAMLAILQVQGAGASGEVILSADDSAIPTWPGEKAQFDLNVTNTGNSTTTTNLSFGLNPLNWTKFQGYGHHYPNLTLNGSESRLVRVVVSLPEFDGDDSQIIRALQKPFYNFTINSTTNQVNKTINLSVLILQIDLVLLNISVDDRFETKAPEIGDEVNLTAVVKNDGTADVVDGRLYIFASGLIDGPDNRIFQKDGSDHTKFDLPAGEETEVIFRWEVVRGNAYFFHVEVNPSCSDAWIVIDCDSVLNHKIDELGRYYNNRFSSSLRYPSGEPVQFYIVPDFTIKNVTLNPAEPYSEDRVKITVTIGNIGNADWELGEGNLTLRLKEGREIIHSVEIDRSLKIGDEVDIIFHWRAPWVLMETVIPLWIVIDTGTSGSKIDQLNVPNDEVEIKVIVKARPDDSTIIDTSYILAIFLSIAVIAAVIIVYKRRAS